MMYNLDIRKEVVSLLNPLCGCIDNVKDSYLFRAYITIKAMRLEGSDSPRKAYEQIKKYAESFEFSILKFRRFPDPHELETIYDFFMRITLCDFLTYAIPEAVCDPHRTIILLEKYLPEKSEMEWAHHIIQIRKLGYQIHSAKSFVGGKNNEDFQAHLYSAYCELEKGDKLPQKLFQKLYSAINSFELLPSELQPSTIGFSIKDIEDLMGILTEKLQMTRDQQKALVTRFFISKAQASQIIDEETLYNFVVCKDRNQRTMLVTKALRLIAKIPPLELLCAISTRKKTSGVNVVKKTEGLLIENDAMLENGFVYPLLKNNIGYEANNTILLLYPSMHFIRKLFSDRQMRNRKITIVLRDQNEVDLLMYQKEQDRYAWTLGKNIRFVTDKFYQNDGNYDKIFLFGNNMPVATQQSTLRQVIECLKAQTDVYALMPSSVLEKDGLCFGEQYVRLVQHIQTIALIPQGINNSTHPRRKIWIHCNGATEAVTQRYITIRSFTMDTA